jgi:cyanophycin synthetase
MPALALHQRSVYLGPNLYTSAQAIRWTLSREAGADWPAPEALAAGLPELLELLPALSARLDHAGSAPPPLAELLMQLTMTLQAEARHPGNSGRVVPQGDGDSYEIVCEYMDPAICREALEAASALVVALTGGAAERRARLSRILEAFSTRADQIGLDQTTLAVVAAAEARGLPWFRLHPKSRIVQLGQGRFARRAFESLVDSEGQITSRFITPYKHLCNHLLRRSGLPVPSQGTAGTLQQAIDQAENIGYPVVMKPGDSGKGHKVIIGLENAEEVAVAFRENFKDGDLVVIERYIPGADHRMLVVGGRLIAAAKRIPASVLGDGRATISDLVAAANRDPRRGLGFSRPLVRLELDATALATLRDQGYGPDAVPPAGRRVFLRKTANISTGGTAVDVTDRVHPDNRRMAELVAGVIGAQVAGIDFITPDIGRSYIEGGAICEVNSTPGLRPHWVAEGGEDRDVVSPILDLCFPPGREYRLPKAVITGTNGKTTTTCMLAHILETADYTPGLVTTLGTSVKGNYIAKGDLAGPRGIEMVARHPEVDAIVAEAARGGLINRGLGLPSCDVGAVLNITTDHLGERGVESLEDMARVKAIVARAVTGTLVLNADDPLCRAMAGQAQAEHICLVSVEPESAPLTAHLAEGGLAAKLSEREGGTTLTLCRDGVETDILAGQDIPATLGGLARHNVNNALFAAALACGLGIAVETIRTALRSFRSDYDTVPGRVNVFDGHPFKVILDYGHNPGGYHMVGRMVTEMAAGRGRRICVFTSPADRNDAHLEEIAEAAAPYFDHFVCRQGIRQSPGRDNLADKLREALLRNGIEENQISLGGDPEKAVLKGLAMARPGDVVYVMSAPRPEESFWDLICSYDSSGALPAAEA